MIQSHPKFPQNSIIEQQQLINLLPRYSTENKKLIVKDNNYFLNTQNLWNNPHQAVKKAFRDFHTSNLNAQKMVQHKNDQQILANMKKKEAQMTLYSSKRQEDLLRLNTRKQERISIQQQCNQQHTEEDLNFQIDSQKYSKADSIMVGRADLSWNKINAHSKKLIKTLITPTVLKMDEQAVQNIQSKIRSDEEIEQIKQELKMKNKHLLRQKFLQKHDENFKFEQKCGLVPNLQVQVLQMRKNGSFQELARPISQEKVTEQFVYDQESRGISSQTQRALKFNQKFVAQEQFAYQQAQKSSPNIIQLATPKIPRISKNPLDRTEFKGLYLAEVDFLSSEFDSTEFTKTIVSGSNFLRDTLQTHMSRPSTKQTRASSKQMQLRKIAIQAPFSMNYYNQLIDTNNDLGIDDMSEIDNFEASLKLAGRRIGFPKMTLIENESFKKS